MSTNTLPDLSKNCYAVLWIHSHHETGEPLQIEVTEWRGRTDVLDQLVDDSKISDLDLSGFPCEDWLRVRVEYSWEETGYSLRLFHDLLYPLPQVIDQPQREVD